MTYLNHQLVGVLNSDWLMFFNFFQDIFINHGHYKDWSISPAPHFFPDMFIFFPLFFLVKNIYFQFLTVCWVMIILSYLSIRIIYSHFFSKLTTIFALTATSSLFLLAFKNTYPYILSIVPAVHIGEFVAGLFLLGIHLVLIDHNKFDDKAYSLCIASGIIAFGAGTSDLLFLVQFACPIFLAYFYLWINKKIKFHFALIFSSIVVAFAFLGAALTKYLVPKDIFLNYFAPAVITKISANVFIIQWQAMLKIIKNINNHVIETIIGVFYFLISFILIINYNNFLKKIKKRINIKIIFLSFFILSSILINIISILFLNNLAIAGDRYFITFYYFPFLFFFFPLACLNHDSYIYKVMTCLSFLMFFYILTSMYSLFYKPEFKIHMSYYPPDIRCIDKVLHRYGHNGIAQYRDANLITSLSRENLQIVPVNPDMKPYYWSINVKKFEKPTSFIILDQGFLNSLNKNIINSKYGTPLKEVTCYHRKILIYTKDSIHID